MSDVARKDVIVAASFDSALHVSFFPNAQDFAGELFYESFKIPFPVPRDNAGLSIPTPPEHWVACRDRGGIAQIVLETAFATLTDCTAWFGYCGDRKAYIVDLRAGYQPTRHRYLIVKWNAELSEAEKRAIEDRFAAIGPF